MKNPYTKISMRTVYSTRWMTIFEHNVIMPSGNKGLYGVVHMKNGSTVLALDDKMNAILVMEYKFAIDRPSLELISGGLDDGEAPLDAAKRELLEEIGGSSNKWVDLGCLDPFSSSINSQNYMFAAMDVSISDKIQRDPDEILNIVQIPFVDVVKMAMNSEITHGASCVAILKTAKILGI